MADILEATERNPGLECDGLAIELCCQPRSIVLEHILLMKEAKFIDWVEQKAWIFRVTWRGYDWLDARRRQT